MWNDDNDIVKALVAHHEEKARELKIYFVYQTMVDFSNFSSGRPFCTRQTCATLISLSLDKFNRHSRKGYNFQAPSARHFVMIE